MDIGFIGLGVMGRPMAAHLIDAGHTLHLSRVKDVSQFLVDKGGKAAKSAADVARAAEVVILMLPDTPDVEAVLFGPGDRGEPTAEDWAQAAGTIAYEIVTRIGTRVPRVYTDDAHEGSGR